MPTVQAEMSHLQEVTPALENKIVFSCLAQTHSGSALMNPAV